MSHLLTLETKTLYKRMQSDFPEFFEFVSEQPEKDVYHFNENKVNYYSVFGDFYRFFISKYREGDIQEIDKIYNFIVYLIQGLDPDVTDLAIMGFLELINAELPEYDEIKKSMPTLLQEWMKKIEDFWGG
jgi:hypothetical protein